ncbi:MULTISPECIES: hypothetical protein [Halobacterium]|uniref:hypothetical protein n=1 Tax=Halobacterium TaxID=2239 RepID=UPI001E62D299|nr:MULTISPECIES: hypothetical protein [Halobacterium]MCG1004924.1 hypothetical protein [Halobacterium noricense]
MPEDAHSVLDETFEQFRYAAQYVADTGWGDDPTEIADQGDLNAATYDDVRDETDLHSNHDQSARSLAAEALSNCQDRLFETGETASKPMFRGTVVVYGIRTITYNDNHCTRATVDGRVRAEYVTPEDDEGTPFKEYWGSDEWEQCEATLHKRDGNYYPHIAVEKSRRWMRQQSRTERFSVLTST